jgi:hypothetical protein
MKYRLFLYRLESTLGQDVLVGSKSRGIHNTRLFLWDIKFDPSVCLPFPSSSYRYLLRPLPLCRSDIFRRILSGEFTSCLSGYIVLRIDNDP